MGGEDRFRGWIPTRFPSDPRLLISQCPKSNVESRHSDVGEYQCREYQFHPLGETSFGTSFVIFLDGDDAGLETKFFLIKRFRMEDRITRRLIKIHHRLLGYSLLASIFIPYTHFYFPLFLRLVSPSTNLISRFVNEMIDEIIRSFISHPSFFLFLTNARKFYL